jgi:chemotaxis signal transduction protein
MQGSVSVLYLIFEAGEYRFALPSARVVEVVPRVMLKAVPGGSGMMDGLLNHGGRLVPVTDLERRLGGAATEGRLSSRIILVERGEGGGEGRMGLIVARVEGLRQHDGSSDNGLPTGRYGSILQWDDDVVTLLDVELLEAVSPGNVRTESTTECVS